MSSGEWVGGASRTRKLRLGSWDTRDPEGAEEGEVEGEDGGVAT